MAEKWWKIRDADVDIIKKGLSAGHKANQYNCPDEWDAEKQVLDRNECSACDAEEAREQARYVLDTGLCVVEEVELDG